MGQRLRDNTVREPPAAASWAKTRAVKSGGSLGGLRPVPVSQRRSACSRLVSALAYRPFPIALSPHERHNDLRMQKKVIYIQKYSPYSAMFITKGMVHGTGSVLSLSGPLRDTVSPPGRGSPISGSPAREPREGAGQRGRRCSAPPAGRAGDNGASRPRSPASASGGRRPRPLCGGLLHLAPDTRDQLRHVP